MLKEFKEFIMRGNVMDMAVGIIIGAAFSAIVSSLVKDIHSQWTAWARNTLPRTATCSLDIATGSSFGRANSGRDKI